MYLNAFKSREKFFVLLIAAAVAATASGCSQSQPAIAKGGGARQVASSAISVQVTYAEAQTLQRETEFAGKLESSQNVKVYPEVSGTVAKTYFNVGDTVKQGDLLFELNSENALTTLKQAELSYQKTLAGLAVEESGSTSAKAELTYQTAIQTKQNAYETARDSLEFATENDFDLAAFKKYRKKLKNAEEAYDADASTENWTAYVTALQNYNDMIDDYASYTNYKDLIVKFENAYDSYLAAVDEYDIYKSMTLGEAAATRDITRAQAELTYENAQKTYNNHKIYAPVSGVVSAKSISGYDVISTSTSAFVISQEGLPSVSFNLSEDGANALNVGDTVSVTYNGAKYTAQITELSPTASTSTGLYAAKAQFSEEIGTTRSGAVVKINAITALQKDALTVSLDNIYYDGNQPYLYIYDNGTAKRVDVIIGLTTADKVSITSGITADDAIITTWHPKLKDGAQVSSAELGTPAAQTAQSVPQREETSLTAPAKKEG